MGSDKMKVFFAMILASTIGCGVVSAAPTSTESEEDGIQTTTEENANDTVPQDLYVIKTVVYEVGILTDADNSTDNSTDTHEIVDLTFFDPKHNESAVDLSNIPIPIQTNISGVQITGIAPANFGAIPLPPENGSTVEPASNLPLKIPIIPNAFVSVTHNISTTNPETDVSSTSESGDEAEAKKSVSEHVKTGD